MVNIWNFMTFHILGISSPTHILFTEKIDSQLNRKYRFPLYEKKIPTDELTPSFFKRVLLKTSDQRPSVEASQRPGKVRSSNMGYPTGRGSLLL